MSGPSWRGAAPPARRAAGWGAPTLSSCVRPRRARTRRGGRPTTTTATSGSRRGAPPSTPGSPRSCLRTCGTSTPTGTRRSRSPSTRPASRAWRARRWTSGRTRGRPRRWPYGHSVGAPLIPSGGGTFEFTVTLANETDRPQALQAWSEVRGPVDRSPVLGPMAVVLPAGATVTRRLVQQVPGAAPSGTYTYTVAVGTFGGAVVAADSFRMTKQGAARAAARSATTGAEGWAVSGWDEAAVAEVGGPSLAVVPNPFGDAAAVTLALAAPSEVTVALYDVLGRRVAVLHAGPLPSGSHAFRLDGAVLRPGLYVLRAETGGAVATRAVTRLR